MEYRSTIFYFSLLLSVLCVAELYVRLKGIGIKSEKIRGEIIPQQPKLFAPLALLIAALIVAALTAPG